MSSKTPFSSTNKYNGNPMTWYAFIRQFEDDCSMKGIRKVTNFNLIDKELSQMEPARPRPTGDDFEDKLILSEYGSKMRQYESEVKAKTQQYIIATGILRSMLADHVINSVELKARARAATFNCKKLNTHQIQSRGELQSLLYFLREQYSPNVALAIERAKARVTEVTNQASITDIVNAIRNFNNEITLLPVLDDDGEVVHTQSGKPASQKPDEQFLLATLLRQLHNPGDPAKMYFYTKTAISKSTSFAELFEELEQFIHHDQTAKTQQGHRGTTDTPASPGPVNPLPTMINYASAEAVKPIVTTPGAICANCGQRDHRTRDCADSTCHTCRRSFPSLLERLYHAGQVHRSKPQRSRHQSNGFDRNRSRSRDREPDQHRGTPNRYGPGSNTRPPSPYHQRSSSPGSQSRSYSPKRVNFTEHSVDSPRN